MTYLHKNHGYWDVAEPLPGSYKVGTTDKDYLAGAYILLSDEQLAFRRSHPGADGLEVVRMERTEERRTLEEAKRFKTANIAEYSRSRLVDRFRIGGREAWLTPEERANYRNSIEAAELLGEEAVAFRVAGAEMTVPLREARLMLARVQRYADACYLVAEAHKDAVAALTDIASVDAFDYTAGYPEPLNFDAAW